MAQPLQRRHHATTAMQTTTDDHLDVYYRWLGALLVAAGVALMAVGGWLLTAA
jgi:hypothetical protein